MANFELVDKDCRNLQSGHKLFVASFDQNTCMIYEDNGHVGRHTNINVHFVRLVALQGTVQITADLTLSASSEELTHVGWLFTCKCKRHPWHICTSTCVLKLSHIHSLVHIEGVVHGSNYCTMVAR